MTQTEQEALETERDYQEVHDNENELFEDAALAVRRRDARAVEKLMAEGERWLESREDKDSRAQLLQAVIDLVEENREMKRELEDLQDNGE